MKTCQRASVSFKKELAVEERFAYLRKSPVLVFLSNDFQIDVEILVGTMTEREEKSASREI